MTSLRDEPIREHVEARRPVGEFSGTAERSRADLEAIITSINEGLITSDPDGGNLFMNEAAQRIYGYGPDPEHRPPRHVNEYADLYDVRTMDGLNVPPEEWAISRVLRGDSFAGEEFIVHRRDTGATFVGRFTGTPVRDKDGNFIRAVLTVSDITEQRCAAEQLRASEERFRLAVSAFTGLVYEYDFEAGSIERSGGLKLLLGFEPEEVEHHEQWWLSRIHPDDAGRVKRAFDQAIESGADSFNMEYRVRHRDGHDVHLWDNGLIVRSAGGEAKRIIGCSIDVTDRKRAQEAQARLATIVATSEAAIISKTLDGTITSWNRGAERTFGYTAEEAIGQPITIIIPRERLEEEDGIRDRLSRGECVELYETIRMTKDGRRIDVWLTVSPVVDDHGRVIGASKIARDITERKQAEAQLRESEARLKLAMEAGRMGAWEWEIVSGTVRWSPGLEAIHGLKPGEFGESFEDFARDIHPEDRERVLEAIRCAVEERTSYHGQYRIVLPDGRLRWIEAQGRLMTDKSGKPARMAGVCMDVTERRQEAEEAQAQVAFRRAVENSVAAGLAAIDLDSRQTYVNRAFCEMVGYSEAELLGRSPPFPYWPREDLTRIRSAFDATLKGAAPPSGFELRFLRRDGTIFDALLVPSPLVGPDGEVRGWLAAVTDITVQKRNEAELARHRDQLEELVIERTVELEASYEQLRQAERMAALGTLSAGLGHDMGNLLLPLRLRLDAIERKTQGSEIGSQKSEVSGQKSNVGDEAPTSDVREDIDAIRKCAEYMQRLTNGLRLFALDPNDEQSACETTDVNQWWADIEPFLKNALPRSVELERQLADDLPRVGIARHLLTQAVFNLVQNAGDAIRTHDAEAPAGKPRASRVCVSVEADHREPVVRVAVADDGPGMTTEVRNRCMEPFFTTKSRGLSTGLGLALVHGIVLRAGGRIEIDSKIGQGTTMTLVLPARRHTAAADESRTVRPAQVEGEWFGRAFVNVADPQLRAFATSVLRALSCTPLAPEEGLAAESIDLAGFDIWITDDADNVARSAPLFFSGSRTGRIVFVGSSRQSATEQDSRIVRLDPAEGRSGFWRAMRTVVADIHRQWSEVSLSDSGKQKKTTEEHG